MKKAIIIIMAMLVSLCAITACGASSETPKGSTANVSLDDVVNKIKAANPVADERVIDDFAVENEMGLDPQIIEEYKGVVTNSQSDCSLIFVAKAKEGKTRELKQQLTDYLSGLAANDLYVEFADKIEKTKQARVLVYDDYVVLSIAGLNVENDVVVKSISEAFGE